MLLFKERFKARVLDGTKTVTRRGLRRKFKVGSVHQAYTRPPFCRPAGAPFAKLLIKSVTITQLGEVDQAEARREGFDSLDDFWAYLGEADGSLYITSELTRIEFEVVE